MAVIEPRSAWNARPPRAVTPRPLSYFRGIRVHHSGGNASATVRDIQNWDMDNKGLVDIGYSYVIRDGRIFEGRGTNHPAHDSINDTFGVCVIGTYTNRLPSAADLDALVDCIRELRRMTGRKLPVDGHRDVAQTACPGDALYRHLPEIRRRADEEDDDMPTPEEIWTFRRKWTHNLYRDWNLRADGFRMVTLLQDAYAWSRRSGERTAAVLAQLEKLSGQVAALVAAQAGKDVRQLIEQQAVEALEHRRQVAADLAARLEAAEAERAELMELVRQADEGRLAAEEVVRLIGQRLAVPPVPAPSAEADGAATAVAAVTDEGD